jgi:NAD(P)-dependent dehydrogenase (short-subunit alcohol dehydrogenase family)
VSDTITKTAASGLSESRRLLAGKTAIVTGASRGIGAATARAFADAGAAVVLAAPSQPEIDALATEIAAAGGEAVAVATDVTDPAAVQRLVQRALDAYGRLDVAFNDAGQGHMPTPLAELVLEDFDRTLAVNARGIFLSMKYEIAAMLGNGGGAIVNMSSTAGLRGVEGIAGYVAGKHAILGLTKVAALDYAHKNIRVNAVAPGPIDSHRLQQLPEERRAGIIADVPLAGSAGPRRSRRPSPGCAPTTRPSSAARQSRSTGRSSRAAHEYRQPADVAPRSAAASDSGPGAAAGRHAGGRVDEALHPSTDRRARRGVPTHEPCGPNRAPVAAGSRDRKGGRSSVSDPRQIAAHSHETRCG